MNWESVFRSEGGQQIASSKGVTSDNWSQCLKFCEDLRHKLADWKGLPPNGEFLELLELRLDNIVACATSERTTLSNAGIKLLATLPEVLPSSFGNYTDRVLPALLKLCGNTKNVTVGNAFDGITAILRQTVYNPRFLWHICLAVEEKTVKPREFACLWIRDMLERCHKHMRANGEIAWISKALKISLNDPNVPVRNSARATYWTFAKYDPKEALEIMNSLDKSKKLALEKDLNNPNRPIIDRDTAMPARPGSSQALLEVKRKQRAAAAKEKAITSSSTSTTTTNNASTPATDEIVVHEPRRKPKDDAKDNTTSASQEQTVRKQKPLPQLPASTPAEDKNNTSRLLSAPVRRGRVVVTPNTNPIVPAQKIRAEPAQHKPAQAAAHTPANTQALPPTPAVSVFMAEDPINEKENAEQFVPPTKKQSVAADRPTFQPVQQPSRDASPSKEFSLKNLLRREDTTTHDKNLAFYRSTTKKLAQRVDIDPLMLKKLKYTLDQNPKTLPPSKDELNILYDSLLNLIHGSRKAPDADIKPYLQGMILQTITILLKNHPQWCSVHFRETVCEVVALKQEYSSAFDRTSMHCDATIVAIIRACTTPAALALAVLQSGQSDVHFGIAQRFMVCNNDKNLVVEDSIAKELIVTANDALMDLDSKKREMAVLLLVSMAFVVGEEAASTGIQDDNERSLFMYYLNRR